MGLITILIYDFFLFHPETYLLISTASIGITGTSAFPGFTFKWTNTGPFEFKTSFKSNSISGSWKKNMFLNPTASAILPKSTVDA